MKKNHPWYNYNTIDARKNKNKKEVNIHGKGDANHSDSSVAEQKGAKEAN